MTYPTCVIIFCCFWIFFCRFFCFTQTTFRASIIALLGDQKLFKRPPLSKNYPPPHLQRGLVLRSVAEAWLHLCYGHISNKVTADLPSSLPCDGPKHPPRCLLVDACNREGEGTTRMGVGCKGGGGTAPGIEPARNDAPRPIESARPSKDPQSVSGDACILGWCGRARARACVKAELCSCYFYCMFWGTEGFPPLGACVCMYPK